MSENQISIISWNVGIRPYYKVHSDNTAKFIPHPRTNVPYIADIITLQEISFKDHKKYKAYLQKLKYRVFTSFDKLDILRKMSLKDPERKGVLIAIRLSSNIKSSIIEFNNTQKYWDTRILSVCLKYPNHENILLHNAYIPHSGYPKERIQLLNELFNRVDSNKDSLELICGDINGPRNELLRKGHFINITMGMKSSKKGDFLKHYGKSLDISESNVLDGFPEYDIIEVYRYKHPKKLRVYCFERTGKGKFNRRCDHIFASKPLKPIECDYIHYYRTKKMWSDHSPIYAIFKL